MATTPILGLPYLEASDPPSLHGAIQALAQALDGEDWHVIGDPGEPAFPGGFWAHSGPPHHDAAFKRVCNVVKLRGAVVATASPSDVMFTLPLGYRPSGGVEFSCAGIGGSGDTARIRISASGEVVQVGTNATVCVLDAIQFET